MPSLHSGPSAEIDRTGAETGRSGTDESTPNLERFARNLAQEHQRAPLRLVHRRAHILQRLEEQARLFRQIHQTFAQSTQEGVVLSYAAEWILDNYYLIRQTLRQVEEDLPAGYYFELPQIADRGVYHGWPRIYALAHALVSHEYCQLDLQRLIRFVEAYQEVTPLRMGELWALPTLLRFTMLESLVQAAGQAAGLYHGIPDVPSALQMEIEEDLGEAVGNCIQSLRLLNSQNWQEFIETVGHVDRILRRDPAGLYMLLELQTRDRYRKVIEKIAAHSASSEVKVAATAIQLARHGSTVMNGRIAGPQGMWHGLELPREAHVGYYLLDEGRRELEARTNYRPPAGERLTAAILGHPTLLYLGSITLITLLITAALVAYALSAGATLLELAAVILLGLLPASAVAVNLINWLLTMLTRPSVLPKLDFSDGVPERCRTMVVIPSLLTSPEEVDSLLSQLELHYLRNADPNIGFALLSDFADAPRERLEEDEALLDQARAGIARLNERYTGRPFSLFHRRRLWNPREESWMGWERKRGKLHEFNQLLRHGRPGSFIVREGDLDFLPAVRYVITLDADTILPGGEAATLIATLAHPLNQARFDEEGQVTAGYTIVQPRTEIMPTSANRSLFTRVFGGDVGLDLYSRAVSDVYQDLFGEGTYVGKGIYDVAAFQRSLAGRVPENALLSHDLFEGIFGRAALATDILLYEEYPPHYLIHVRRSHRWVRGDWQLLPWLLPRVPTVDGWQPNPLALIDRWKIFDNLRRSLEAPALFFLLVAGWTMLPGSPAFWTLVALLTPAVALLTSTLMGMVRRIGGASWREVWRPVRDSAIRWLLYVSFLPFETLLALDAVLTTLWRLLVSRKNLLHWTTAAHTVRLIGQELSAEATLTQMLPSYGLALLALLVVVALRPAAGLVAVPLIFLWLAAAQIAHRISRPEAALPTLLSEADRQKLRRLARRTWFFFEQYVGPEDNWLPPDHFQEHPRGVVAHRTSPTNVGLYLLSLLAAHDLGYVGLVNLSLRLLSTFDTLDKLDRFRGHFLNWIETTTLRPLPPGYVSTVDSGNLAACLLALKQACLAIPHQAVMPEVRWQNLLDLLSLLEEEANNARDNIPTGPLLAEIATMQQLILDGREDRTAWPTLLTRLQDDARPRLEQQLVVLVDEHTGALPPERFQELRLLIDRGRQATRRLHREADMLLPWLPLLSTVPENLYNTSLPPDALAAWTALWERLTRPITLEEIIHLSPAGRALQQQILPLLDENDPAAQEVRVWLQQLNSSLHKAGLGAEALLLRYRELAGRAETLVQEMNFTFLFNEQRQVFHIGYNLDAGRLDPNFYDLLASEARIASIVAISKGDVPESHWLHLARPVARLTGGLTLLSWSGTMFEYLMAPLLMRSYRGTLLAQSEQAALTRHIEYGAERGVPWGISESGFYAFDNAQNYQYRAFGVPGLGFKRGLAEDLVVAPYASLLALPLRPDAVVQNMDALAAEGASGRYGFYEAIDYTHSRLELGRHAAVVRSFMAHHQGMIMVALVNYLQGDRMVERFHTEPRIQSVEMMLQERIPARPALEQARPEEEPAPEGRPAEALISAGPWDVPTDTPMPQVHYLSNGHFSTLITNAGSGYSAGRDLAYTRWRPDTTLDDWGLWLYVQDLERNALWSAGIQPTGVRGDSYQVQYFPHLAQFRRRDYDISLQMDVTIAPEYPVEIRRLDLVNHSDETRHLRLTSYGEVVLAPFETDLRHPTFAKLFVESEYVPEFNALFFRRRPRQADEQPRFLGHMLVVADGHEPTRAHETDRARFLGRGQTAGRPAALRRPAWLSGTTGATLDPVMSLGQLVTLEPHQAIRLAYVTFSAASREELLVLAERYARWTALERAFVSARNQAERELRRLNLTVPVLQKTQQMLSLLLYPHPAGRAPEVTLATNEKGQSGLWAYGISGDYPILLLRLGGENDAELLQTLLRAHTYWRRRGLRIDLVVLNMQESHYGRPLHSFINRLITRLDSAQWLNRRGGIYLLRRDQLTQADHTLLQTAARLVLDGPAGSLAEQLSHLTDQPAPLPDLLTTLHPDEVADDSPPLPRPDDLRFDNGWGGFSLDGREYLIYLEPGRPTPLPWINVIANEQFGFLISESGGGFTWAGNSGENRLTDWRNDPVTDMPAEALYLRDEETGEVWSPLAQPAPTAAPYLVHHGAGYTTCRHHSHSLKQHVRFFVSPDEPVKFVQLQLENCSGRARRITATFYAEWVLGTRRDVTLPYLIPWYRPDLHALLVRNPYNAEFGQEIAFVASSREPHGLTADRTEFIGRLGSLRRPAALRRVGLDSRVRPGQDSCAALQVHFDLAPGETQEIHFLVGQGTDEQEVERLVNHFRPAEAATAALQTTHEIWDTILGTVQVETPDPAMDLLLNRWLLYQALACRLWGRSALYQSSGAYGFRDQLQDVLSLVHARPDLTRQHLLRSARHQFTEGDVLHWWHPPSGRGVRTRITDDLVWLPYVTAYYVKTTGDTAVLDEQVPFLTAPELAEDEEERYGLYDATAESYSLYEHCCRALERASTHGRHDLPLMGAGDWNDGMNRVGIEGEGESVWLGWFLANTLHSFADLAAARGDEGRAGRFRERAAAYVEAIEEHGWDGEWYRRAYYDDGTPLGSRRNRECQIDSLSQSWAVLTGTARPERVRQAMAAVNERLILEDEQLILLFTPPFDKTSKDPGYIKGYLPGVRENGGQYTHAALWTIWAFAEMGEGERAEALYRLINPIYRADTAEKAQVYKVEPYVIAADVYGVPPHEGRGGWTWYTGSSGWMYRLGVERLLGLHREGQTLRLDPRIPPHWPGYRICYRHGRATYEITVENPAGVSGGVARVTFNGKHLPDGAVPLRDDEAVFQVLVTLQSQ